MSVRGNLLATLALSLVLAGCEVERHQPMRCPQVVNYSEAQLTAIQESINRLPQDDPLRAAMQDYETLRDDARFCTNSLIEK